jgi:hypothetical protein
VLAPDLIVLLFKACAEFDLSVNGRPSNGSTAIKLFEVQKLSRHISNTCFHLKSRENSFRVLGCKYFDSFTRSSWRADETFYMLWISSMSHLFYCTASLWATVIARCIYQRKRENALKPIEVLTFEALICRLSFKGSCWQSARRTNHDSPQYNLIWSILFRRCRFTASDIRSSAVSFVLSTILEKG